MLEKAVVKQKTGVEKLQAFGETYFKFAEKHPNYYTFVTLFDRKNASNAINEFATDRMISMDDLMRHILYTGINDGTIRKDIEPKVISKCLWGMANGVLELIDTKASIIQRNSGITKDLLKETFFKMIIDSVKA